MSYNSVEEAVYNQLISDTVFMANFKGVYWQEADTTTYPYIVFWTVDDNGLEERLNKPYQGEARIQFDLWDDNKNRGAKLKTTLREKVRNISVTDGGYYLLTEAVTEQTMQRQSATDPYHYIVDGIIKWNKE